MPKNYAKVLKQGLKQIRPSSEERRKLLSVSKKVLAVTKKEAKKVKARAMLVGSLTRDTWLPGKMEFDVFMLFPEKLTKKKLEVVGLKVGKKIVEKMKGTYVIEYAEHPYVAAKIDGVAVDIVPCFEVKSAEHLKSAVDRTPFHVKYIEKNLAMSKSDEVRLLKQFCKANGIYGADAKTEGFSGFVSELLTIQYGKFLNVLKDVAKMKAGEIVDIEKAYSKKDFMAIRKKFWNQVLVLIDPTDRNRNAAAAISAKSFFTLKKAAQEFLDNPMPELFFERRANGITEHELITRLMNRRTEIILIKFLPPKVVPDILWPQMRRFAERMQSILEEVKYEFKVLRKDVYTNEKEVAVVLLEMEVSKLPSVQKRIGPSVFDAKDAENFVKKYKEQAIRGPFVENSNWVVEVTRKFLTAKEKLIDSLSKPVDILKAKGVPNYIADEIAKSFEVVNESSKIMDVARKDSGFGVFLKKYFGHESLA